jgi:peptide-methionine (S)-S-oxide reductase
LKNGWAGPSKRTSHRCALSPRRKTYHQKYYLKQHSLYKELSRIYPRHQDLVDSTAAARMNGYLGGSGTKTQLERRSTAWG